MTPPPIPDSRGNIVCDLDGVVYRSQTAVPGAGRALAVLEERGHRIVFATNAPMRTPAEVAAHIAGLSGYPARTDQVVTSAMAAAAMLQPADAPTYVLGESGLAATLQAEGRAVTLDAGTARSVVVGLDRHMTYDQLRAAAEAVLAGARFIGCNRDATYPTETGLWPGGGAIVAALETATGRSAEVAGKPYPAMVAAVRRALGPGPTWVVGDRPETDLALGHADGWRTVLVLSGVTADAAAVPETLQPDLVVPSLADLPARLR